MFAGLKHLLLPPIFEDEEKSRMARLLYASLLTMTVASLAAAGITWANQLYIQSGALLVGVVIQLSTLVLVRSGKIRLTIFIVILSMLGVVTFLCFTGFGIHDNAAIIYPIIIIVASLLLRRWGLLITTGLAILSVGIVVTAEIYDIIQTPFKKTTSLTDFFIVSIILLVTAITVRLLSDNLIENLDRARNNEQTLAETNQRLADQTRALKASETLYRQAIESADAVPYYQDYSQDTYVFMGQGIKQLTGYSPEELTPRLWGTLQQEISLQGESAGLSEEEATRRARRGEIKVWRADVRIRDRDGKTRWITDSAIEIQDENGISQGSIGILQDITKRKQSEILQTVLYEVAEAVHTSTDLPELFKFIHDSLGKLMDVRNLFIALREPGNPNLFSFPYAVDEQDTFQPVEDLTGSLTAYVARTGLPALITKEAHEELIRLGEVQMIGAQSAIWLGVPLKIGENIIGVAVVQNYTDPKAYNQEHIVLMSFVSRQIALATERKRAQDALRDSEARFRALIENSDDMILILNPNGIVQYASPSVMHIMGYPPEELVGGDIFKLIHPEDIPRLSEEWRRIATRPGGEPGITEARIQHIDGSWHIHEGIGNNLFHDPAVKGFVLNTRDITDRKRSEAELQTAHNDLRIAYEATIEGWSHALDLRDKETEGHTQRVADMTVLMARCFGVSDVEISHLRRGALLHDIGKMGIPDSILQKPGPLTDDEWIEMRKHPIYAYEMLSPIHYLRPALDIPLYHHEKWDGSGYPRGLKGEEIPLAARMFTVVDVWDALSSDRPYRKRLPEPEVMQYIQLQRNHHFDPQMVDIFMNIVAR